MYRENADGDVEDECVDDVPSPVDEELDTDMHQTHLGGRRPVRPAMNFDLEQRVETLDEELRQQQDQ